MAEIQLGHRFTKAQCLNGQNEGQEIQIKRNVDSEASLRVVSPVKVNNSRHESTVQHRRPIQIQSLFSLKTSTSDSVRVRIVSSVMSRNFFIAILLLACRIVADANPVANAFDVARGVVGRVDWRRLQFWKRGNRKARLDPSFVASSSANLDALNSIIDELSAENEVLRTQSMIYKKNVQYHKDISARLRKEKEVLRVAVDTVRQSTEDELNKRFNLEKAELMKTMQADFDDKTKGMKAELKEAKHELKTMSKQLESAKTTGKQEITIIKDELKAASKKLSASEALVKSLEGSLQQKDKELAEAKKSKAKAPEAASAAPKQATKQSQSTSGSASKASAGASRASKPSAKEKEGVRATGSGSKAAGPGGGGAPLRGSATTGKASLKKPAGAKSARK